MSNGNFTNVKQNKLIIYYPETPKNHFKQQIHVKRKMVLTFHISDHSIRLIRPATATLEAALLCTDAGKIIEHCGNSVV